MIGKILTPIVTIAYIAWSVSAFYFVADMAHWFFDTEGIITGFLATLVAFFVLMLPFGSLVIAGLVFYYLAFVLGWNIWLVILYTCPGIIFALASGAANILTMFTSRRR